MKLFLGAAAALLLVAAAAHAQQGSVAPDFKAKIFVGGQQVTVDITSNGKWERELTESEAGATMRWAAEMSAKLDAARKKPATERTSWPK